MDTGLRSAEAPIPLHRKLQLLGNHSVGVTLDKGDARADGILERLENGEDVHAEIRRQDEGEWLVRVPDLEREESERD